LKDIYTYKYQGIKKKGMQSTRRSNWHGCRRGRAVAAGDRQEIDRKMKVKPLWA
jgi:hypothetical protein